MSYIYKNIKKTYIDKVALDISEIVFDAGKIYGIKGFNGSGKSTFCKILAKVEIPDTNIVHPSINIGYMPQSSYVFDMSVIKNVLLNVNDNNKEKKEEMAREMLKKFDLAKYEKINAKNLSGGEKQKLSLARLMIKHYDMLILDEPTSSMDYKSTLIADDLICEYAHKNNSVVIMVSHEEDELKRITKNIIKLESGKIVNS